MSPGPKRKQTPSPGMSNKKRVSKRKSVPKKKVTKEIKMVPRLRLEPLLISNSNEIIEKEENTKKVKSETLSYIPFEDGPIEEIDEQILGNDGEEISKMINTGLARMSPVTSFNAAGAKSTVNKNVTKHTKVNFKINPSLHLSGLATWSDRELMDLATGLQSVGFAELDKVADIVKTKSKNEISQFIKRRRCEVNKRETTKQKRGRTPNIFFSMNPENLSSWPVIRKWRRMASDQMLDTMKGRDISKLVMPSLFNKFYEEEEEVTNPEVINVKAIYKYLLDCMNGHIPAQLPPKESAVVINLLKEVRSLPFTHNFEEELDFLRNYKGATKFRPIHVKDEFKKRFTKRVVDDDPGSQVVAVAESVFLELSRHKRVVQSFNPLVTPVWLLQKEQELLGNYISNDVNI